MDRIKPFLFYLVSFFVLCSLQSAKAQDTASIRKSVKYQMTVYPASTLCDLYKNFFQDAYGPGHLMPVGDEAEAKMRKYLRDECEKARHDTTLLPYYEQTGALGNFVRVSLSSVNDGIIPFDTLFSALLESMKNNPLPSQAEWHKIWNGICKEINNLYPNIESFSKDYQYLKEMLNQGHFIIHHSERYKSAYHPHYRLIRKDIFDQRLMPLFDNKTRKKH
ncbi:MAG: hypothetical protein KBS65_04490 [Prevotella sp.]|nr:hypothetical protein [Candidatus Equicola stercoris]